MVAPNDGKGLLFQLLKRPCRMADFWRLADGILKRQRMASGDSASSREDVRPATPPAWRDANSSIPENNLSGTLPAEIDKFSRVSVCYQ